MNSFAFSALIIAVASIVFGVSIYNADRSSKLARLWLWVTFALALWSGGLYGVTTASTAHTSLLWQYVLDVGAICIPFFYLRFVLGSIHIKKHFVEIVAGLGALALIILSFTPLYKVGMIMLPFGFYWIQIGSLYFLFPIYFIITAGYAFLLLVRTYWINTENTIIRGQIRNHLMAALVGFGGGLTDFFPQFFHIFPFGNYFVVIFVVFAGYAILHYNFFNIKVIAAQFFASALVLITLLNLFKTQLIGDWILQFGFFILVSIFSVLLVKSVYQEVEHREQIQKLAEELKKTNARQESIIHFISHEVKGFLTKDINVISMLADGDFGTLPNEAKTFAEEALAQARESVRAVINILQAANLKKGVVTYSMVPTDLIPVVKKSFATAVQTAKEKGISLTLSINQRCNSCVVTADAEKLSEYVFRNLIENAVAYTPKGSVTVSLGKSDDEKKAIFSVQDTGVGINDEDKKYLFTEGGHGKDSIKVNAHSTGYGLYIAQQITQAHHGTIRAESAGTGMGSRFIVELPV